VERLGPDILIVDFQMPGLNGIDVAKALTQRGTRTRTILLSMHANEAYVIQALRNGALGYVLKESGGTELVSSSRTK
jgi:DNA-binding NarL/FixJ family response regulator